MVIGTSENTKKSSHTNSDECFKDLQKYSIFVDEGTSTNGGNRQ